MDITNKELVVSYFGYWPIFADSKIVELYINNETNSIKMVIHYIDSDKNKKAKISLVFSGVKELELNEVRTENVLDELAIDNKESFYQITLISCFGVSGKFSCTSVAVEYVHA